MHLIGLRRTKRKAKPINNMFFKKKDKELKKTDSDKKNPGFKNLSITKETVPASETNKKPLIDTSFVFFEDK